MLVTMRSATPKNEPGKIMLRLNQETMDQIDALVTSGRYKDRVDVCRAAIDRLLNEGRARAETDQAIREGLLSGRYDAEIEMQVRKVLGQVVSPNNVHRSDEP